MTGEIWKSIGFILLLAMVIGVFTSALPSGGDEVLTSDPRYQTDAELGEFPYTVSVRSYYQGKVTHICGGVLVSDKLILTAGTCVKDYGWQPQLYNAVTSEYDLHRDAFKHQGHSLKKLVSLESSNRPPSSRQGIAFLVPGSTQNRQKAPPSIQPVMLPDEDEDFSGKMCVTIGWGNPREECEMSHILQKIPIQILSKSQCSSVLGGKDTRDDVICGTRGHHFAFRGDLGGPLLCKVHGEWTLAGVLNSGHSCIHESDVLIFAKTTFYLWWIELLFYDNNYQPPARVVPTTSTATATTTTIATTTTTTEQPPTTSTNETTVDATTPSIVGETTATTSITASTTTATITTGVLESKQRHLELSKNAVERTSPGKQIHLNGPTRETNIDNMAEGRSPTWLDKHFIPLMSVLGFALFVVTVCLLFMVWRALLGNQQQRCQQQTIYAALPLNQNDIMLYPATFDLELNEQFIIKK